MPALQVPPEWLVLLGLAGLALLSRIFTTNSLAGEPSPDEFLFGVYARDLARSWGGGAAASLGSLTSEGRSIAVTAAALRFVLPWDVITIGRTTQALFNALCIPATYLLGREIGLTRTAAVGAGLLLLAIPEFQELAWRFWADSQATLLGLLYLALLARLVRRRSALAGLVAVPVLALLALTKESVAVVFAMVFPATLVAAVWRARIPWPVRLVAAMVPLLAVAGAVAAVTSGAPFVQRLLEAGLLRRTLETGPVLLTTARGALPALPSYLEHVRSQIGPRELSPALLWALGVAGLWLVASLLASLLGLARPGRREAGHAASDRLAAERGDDGPAGRGAYLGLVAGWLAALALWAPFALVVVAGLGAIQQPVLWATLAAAGVVLLAGAVRGRGGRVASPWGFALGGLVVLGFLLERLVIVANPRLGGGAALTFRTFMPVVPLVALLAGQAVSRVAAALAPPRVGAAGVSLASLALVAVLVGRWSPLLTERLSPHPLIGRVAVRGADPTKAEGLMIEVLAEAEPWLEANILPVDPTITGLPRQLAWYADLGVGGLGRLVDLGSQPRNQAQRRAYIQTRVGPTGATYVVDFNVHWTAPDSDEARQWRQTYAWLAAQPHLAIVYSKRDPLGYPVFYVARNYGYALPPGG